MLPLKWNFISSSNFFSHINFLIIYGTRHLNIVVIPFSCFPFPFFNPLNIRFHVFHYPFLITWTEFLPPFPCFPFPFFFTTWTEFLFMFSVPLFSSLEQSFCSCFPFSFFITSGLLLWIRLRSRFSPLPLCSLFSLRLLNNEVRGWNRARLLDNKSISAWTATLSKR